MKQNVRLYNAAVSWFTYVAQCVFQPEPIQSVVTGQGEQVTGTLTLQRLPSE